VFSSTSPLDDQLSANTSAAVFDPPVSRLLITASAILLLSVAARLITSWHNYGDLDTPSGVWTTMAVDLVDDATLYRPMISTLGYGGTRYGPLHPVLQAALMRLGISPVNSGYLLAVITTVAILAGLYAVMRELGSTQWIAIVAAIFALSANCFLEGIAKIHGDPLSLALELWGLVSVLRLAGRDQRSGLTLAIIAGTCFALAAAAKVTSAFGIFSALAWLLLHGKRRQAGQLFLVWALVGTILILATQWASQGRAISIFHQTAAGGGGLTALMQGPHRFFTALSHSDRVCGGFLILALALLLILRTWHSLPALLLLITTAGTIAIFGSPGTGINHLMSLQAASILVVGVSLGQIRSYQPALAVVILLLVGIGMLYCLKQIREICQERQRDQMESILADIRQSSVDGPIYANDPFLPILANQRPYLLDGFMARLMRQKDPASAAKLWDDLENVRFSACITHTHPAEWTDVVADDAVIAAHLNRYHLESTHGTAQVYLPNPK
jgi:hypothetical protein